MRKRLFIRLERDGSASWALLDGQPEAPAVIKRGTLEEAATGALGARVTVLVPTNDVLLAAVRLPPTQKRRLLTAVPYALEDQLADDVEDLHFALGSKDETGQWNTAVVDLALMRQWISRLSDAGIQADSVAPDMFALPWRDGEWSVLLEDDMTTLRTGLQSGLNIDDPDSTEILKFLIDSTGEFKPSRLNVIDCRQAGQSPFNPDFGVEVDVLAAHEPPINFFAQSYDENNVIDLLQGEFSRREQLSKYWRPWRAAAGLLVAVLVVQMVSAGFEQWRLGAESKALYASAKEIYVTTFNAKNVPDPRGQMKQKLAELRGGTSGGGEMFGLLAKAGPSFDAIAGVVVERLNYRAGEVTVSLTLPDLQKLDELKQHLVGQSLKVDIQSATSRDGKVDARLQIGGGAA